MTVIIDYGVGNLFSLESSFAAIGEDVKVSADESVISSADRVILPGVGAFGDAAAKLCASGLDQTLVRLAGEGMPILGICLGMQLLFDRSFEYGEHAGLGLVPGSVVPIDAPGLKIPQIGWNSLDIVRDHPIMKYTQNGDFVYFVHSYAATDCSESLVATCEYGQTVTAAVAAKNVCGTQFHPEKSGDTGLRILKAFCEMR